MSLIVKERKRELAPEGRHLVRATEIVGLGWQDFYGPKPRVRFGFQLLLERNSAGYRFNVGREFTLTFSKQGNLRPFLEDWLGRPLTKEELEDGFDLRGRLGEAGEAEIKHVELRDGTVGNVLHRIAPVPQGTEAPMATGDFIFYDAASPDPATFKKLPQWIQDRIEGALEGPPGDAEEQTREAKQPVAEFDDDIPF